MARREDIEKLREQAEQSKDLPTLESVHKQFAEILTSLNANLRSTRDEDVITVLTEIRDEAQYADDELKRRIAEIKVDMLDPSYEQRQAERERAKQAKKMEEEMWQRKFATEGLGGIFKGLGDVLNGNQPSIGAMPGAPAIAATNVVGQEIKCGCGAVLQVNAKFCTECGQPVVREKLCTSCGCKLQPGTKFCSECGTKNA
ncbi:MAG TPA: zinc ribbon domain-containing protein [Clostridia bacterium]|nr:zinc ribbon domain-containing protein [Clostridia bacterium]